MKQLYVQCLLTKNVNVGNLKTISWIPSQFAEKYRVLKLQSDDGSWSDGWLVQEIYGTNSAEFILTHERDFAKQRKASDI